MYLRSIFLLFWGNRNLKIQILKSLSFIPENALLKSQNEVKMFSTPESHYAPKSKVLPYECIMLNYALTNMKFILLEIFCLKIIDV